MTDQQLFEKYDELNKDTGVYQNHIDGWDKCTLNVLANKIKGVQNYLDDFRNELIQIDRLYTNEPYNTSVDKTEFLYKRILRTNDFKGVEDFYIFNKMPDTWSVNVGKDYDAETDNPYYTKNKYYVYVNTKWLNYYPRWIELYLTQMRDRLEQSKQKTAKKEKTSILCGCGGQYTPVNRAKHFNSKRHIDFETTAKPITQSEPEKEPTKPVKVERPFTMTLLDSEGNVSKNSRVINLEKA